MIFQNWVSGFLTCLENTELAKKAISSKEELDIIAFNASYNTLRINIQFPSSLGSQVTWPARPRLTSIFTASVTAYIALWPARSTVTSILASPAYSDKLILAAPGLRWPQSSQLPAHRDQQSQKEMTIYSTNFQKKKKFNGESLIRMGNSRCPEIMVGHLTHPLKPNEYGKYWNFFYSTVEIRHIILSSYHTTDVLKYKSLHHCIL